MVLLVVKLVVKLVVNIFSENFGNYKNLSNFTKKFVILKLSN